MVHIRTKSVSLELQYPRDTSKKALHKYCKLPKLTPVKGVSRQPYVFVISFFILAGISGTQNCQALCSYMNRCSGTKIAEIFHAPKYFANFLWTHNIFRG